MRRWLNSVAHWIALPVFAVLGLVVAAFVRYVQTPRDKPSFVWGSTPLINNRHWSRAMRAAGYSSETFTSSFYSAINQRTDWDRVLDEQWPAIPAIFKPMAAFLWSLLQYDVFVLSADGYFIGRLAGFWRMQRPLLRFAGKKVVFVPYGGDAYVYRRVRSPALLHALMASYPKPAREQHLVEARLDYWCRHADACISTVAGADGFGRWDVLLVSPLCLDLTEWRGSSRQSRADGLNGIVTICHAPNHQGFKGSEFVIDAVRRLQEEGLQVKLLLLEKVQNAEVRRVLQEDADILVEQLVFGHGLNAIEGMASGLPVISNLEHQEYLLPARRWSYFSECPIVSAEPENLMDVLRKLVTRPSLRNQLGQAGRQYVHKYHGQDSAVHLFEAVLDLVYGRTDSLINLYHPLLGTHPRRMPRVEHPLVNNRIVD